MNSVKLNIEVEYTDKYIEAKNKLLDFAEALDKLTPMQKEQLAKEFIVSMGMAASLDQFIKYMNNGGQV